MTQDELTVWQIEHDPNARMCTVCGKSIWYENTVAVVRSKGQYKDKACYKGTSYKTVKKVGNTKYSIKKCSLCLSKALPTFLDKNKSRIFNTLNEFTSYAFDIPMNIINEYNKKYVPTIKNMISKYGEELGTQKWNEYVNKQRISNSLEYKRSKFGWDESKFNEYNKSRGVTLKNLINKYGEEEGKLKWGAYIKKQKLTKSKDYVIKKYGIHYWLNLCKSKANTYENFIKRYGIKDGPILFESYITKLNFTLLYSSKVATEFFDELIKGNQDLFKNYTIYYAGNTLGEFGKYCDSNSKYYFVDFYIKELNLAIEFNGDYFHANPKIYSNKFSDFWHTDLSADEIRKLDEDKINALYNDHRINTVIVWESEYNENKEKTFLRLINIIKKINNETISD